MSGAEPEDRQALRQALRAFCGQLADDGRPAIAIWHLHAVPGVGATDFLRGEVSALCAEGLRDLKPVFVYLDCADAAGQSWPQQALLHAIITEIRDTLTKEAAEWADVQAARDALCGLAEGRGVLVACDRADALRQPDFEWLEQNFLAPMLDKPHALVILGSNRRDRPALESFALRRRRRTLYLAGLTRTETSALCVEAGLADEDAKLVYTLTAGHARGVEYLIRGIQADRKMSQRAIARVLEPAVNDLLRDVCPTDCGAARDLAVLRAFNQYLISDFLNGAPAGIWKGDGIASRLNHALEQGLARWDAERSLSVFRPEFRCIVLQYLWLDDRERYLANHENAQKLHERQAACSANAVTHIIESLYHRWSRYREQKLPGQVDDFDDHTLDAWVKKLDLRPEDRRQLQIRLRNDPDLAQEFADWPAHSPG